MSQFIEVRTLAGQSFIRVQDVIAVQYVDPQKSTVMMAGGAQIPCSEPAKTIMSRVQAGILSTSETNDGHGSR